MPVACHACAKPSGRRERNCSCACTFARISGGGGVKPATKVLLLGLAALLVAVVALDLAQSTQAQSDDEQAGRIVARRLDDGRTEFGWQPASGERVLPRARYFPADVGHQRWLNSSPVEVDGVEIGRINARLREDGRIEFGFTPTDGERIAPSARYFPVDAAAGYWLRSTEIAISQSNDANPFIAVSAGGRHTCGLRESGDIECWGSSGTLRWDEETETWEDVPLPDAPAGSFTAVSAGSRHTCGLRESGDIECWGGGVYGHPPAGSFTAVSVSGAPFGTGDFHLSPMACGLHENGAIECWGATWASQGGDRIEEGWWSGRTNPPAGSFTAVSAGRSHGCGLREDGAIECWNTRDWRADPPAGSFTAVSVGGHETCGLRESGEIECWGGQKEGRTGRPTEGRFSAVSAGAQHACGLRESGEIECWGKWDDGWADAGQYDAPAGPFSAVSAGFMHSCGLRKDGAIECWGLNEGGQTDAPDL